MKTKKIIIIIICLCIIAFIPGVTGLMNIYEERQQLETNNSKDLMVGMIVSTEPLSIKADNTTIRTDKYYARLTDKSYTNEETGEIIKTAEYVFENLNGYGCYSFFVDDGNNGYYSRVIDDIFCDCNINSNGHEMLDENVIEATIYYCGDFSMFYLNPVYQSSDGEVYAVQGDAMSVSGDSVSSMSTSLKDVIKETRNGQLITRTNEVKLNVENVDPIKEIILLQMNEESQLIKSDRFTPGKLPINYYPEDNAEFIIVETVTADDGKEKSERKIVDKSENWFDTYETLDNGMYKQHATSLNW